MKEKILSLTKKNKKRLLYLTIVIFMLTTLLSYAYLASISSDVTKTEISGTGLIQETLYFETTGDINIELNSETFGANASDVVSTVTASVIATAKDNGEVYTDYYNAYVVIDSEFSYSKSDETPEIILTITDEFGNEITEVEGLSYSSLYNGFDITTVSGTFEIFVNDEISTDTVTMESWILTVTLPAHSFDQSINEGANFSISVYLSDTDEPVVPESSAVLLSEAILMNEGDGFDSAEEAITYINSKTTPDFSTTATTDEGIFATEDNYGDSYYFRGATEDNYVEFADMLWRIIRIDGDGNIELMLYNEDSSARSYQPIKPQLTYDYAIFFTESFSVNYNDGSGIFDAKYTVENWYSENLSAYSAYVTDTKSCLNSIASDSYNLYSLLCDSEYEYSYSVSLIGLVEVIFAGGAFEEINNQNFYLYTNYSYWVVTSGASLDGMTVFLYVSDYGYPYGYRYGYNLSSYVDSETKMDVYKIDNGLVVFPVVTLNSVIKTKEGNGTIESPYKIVME